MRERDKIQGVKSLAGDTKIYLTRFRLTLHLGAKCFRKGSPTYFDGRLMQSKMIR